MVRDNINIIRDFFRLVKGSKLWITFLFLGSILAHLCSLLNKYNFSNKVISYAIKNEFLEHQTIYECVQSENLLISDVLKDFK